MLCCVVYLFVKCNSGLIKCKVMCLVYEVLIQQLSNFSNSISTTRERRKQREVFRRKMAGTNKQNKQTNKQIKKERNKRTTKNSQRLLDNKVMHYITYTLKQT